jgi:hypothetical protein
MRSRSLSDIYIFWGCLYGASGWFAPYINNPKNTIFFPVIQMPLFLKTGKRLDVSAMQTFCVRQSGECFIRCIGNSECQSFGIGVVDECLGQLQCRLYSQVEISDLTNDTKYTYYIQVSYNALHFPIALQ